MSKLSNIILPDGTEISVGGGYKLVASVETEEEVSRIALSGFEANELLIITKLKKT